MNKLTRIQPEAADADIGPVDADGQQILSAEEEAMLDRLQEDPEYLGGVEAGLADIRAGRTLSHEEFLASRAEQRRRWFAVRSI